MPNWTYTRGFHKYTIGRPTTFVAIVIIANSLLDGCDIGAQIDRYSSNIQGAIVNNIIPDEHKSQRIVILLYDAINIGGNNHKDIINTTTLSCVR